MRLHPAALVTFAMAGAAQAETTYITGDRLLGVERSRYGCAE